MKHETTSKTIATIAARLQRLLQPYKPGVTLLQLAVDDPELCKKITVGMIAAVSGSCLTQSADKPPRQPKDNSFMLHVKAEEGRLKGRKA